MLPRSALLVLPLAAWSLTACGSSSDTTEAATGTTSSSSASSSSSGSSSSATAGGTVLLSHLVIDSGSSGTRFCVYLVARDAASTACRVGDAAPICAKSEGGLAALTEGKPAADVPGLVELRGDEAWAALEAAYVAAGKPATQLDLLRAAAALGTGGYRDPATAAPAAKPEWDAVWTTIDGFLEGKGLTQVVAKAIPGEDEAKLAWVGVREAVDPSGPFAILETGGATLQLGAGAPADAYDALVGASIYRGQNFEFKTLSSDPAFSVCSSPMDRTKQDGAKCVAYLTAKIHSDNALTALAKTVSPRALYGLGAPWSGLFREFPAAPPWTPKTDSEFGPGFTVENLKALAAKVCPLSDAELLAFAPNSYDATTMSGRACYAVSFHAAYLDSVKAVAMDATILAGGDDQWARGASVTPKFFADCE